MVLSPAFVHRSGEEKLNALRFSLPEPMPPLPVSVLTGAASSDPPATLMCLPSTSATSPSVSVPRAWTARREVCVSPETEQLRSSVEPLRCSNQGCWLLSHYWAIRRSNRTKGIESRCFLVSVVLFSPSLPILGSRMTGRPCPSRARGWDCRRKGFKPPTSL